MTIPNGMPKREDTDRPRPEDALIEAVLEATGRKARRVFEFGPFRLDVADHRLFRGAKPVPLPPKEFDTLKLLVERHGRLVTKEDLLKTVWDGAFVAEGTIAQRISFLRRTLGSADDGRPYIETVPRRGYRFAARVTESDQ